MQKSHLQRSNLFSSKHVSLKINILNRETNDFWLIYYFIATIQFVTLLFIWSCWASAQEIKLTTNEKKSLNIYNYTYFKWVTINNYRIVSRKTQAKNANNNVFVCQYLIWTTLQRSSCRKLLNIVKFKIIEFVREWLAVTNATHKKLKKNELKIMWSMFSMYGYGYYCIRIVQCAWSYSVALKGNFHWNFRSLLCFSCMDINIKINHIITVKRKEFHGIEGKFTKIARTIEASKMAKVYKQIHE